MEHLLPIQPGCLVEFLQDNQPILAWTLEAVAGKARLFTVGQRETKLPLSRVLPWTGPQYATGASRQEMLETLRRHHGLRASLAEAIDTLAIWELAQGELSEADVSWLGSLIFAEPSPDHLAALGRKLLQTKTHFRFNPPRFEIFPHDVVARRQEELLRAEERRRLVGFSQEFLRALWDRVQSKPTPIPTPDPEQEARLRALLMARIITPEDRESELLWKTMAQGLPEDPWLPLLLAEAWGIVPRHFNVALARADYTWEPSWAQPFHPAVHALLEHVASTPLPEDPTPYLTVDAATTQDIDDGFWVEPLSQAGWRVRIALSCPALGWPWGSPLDLAVRHRFSSLYLPEGTSHMLPEALGIGGLSLHASTPRPALIVQCHVNQEGEVLQCTPELARIQVASNTTYAAVEAALEHGHPALTAAFEAAQALRERRIREGAVITEQADPYLVLQGDGPEVRLHLPPPTPRAQTIVSELMVLGNAALAAFALRQQIPLLFRTQNIALPPECAGVWREPQDIYRILGRMGPSLLETEPRRHATVAAPAYATCTSPLRRYVDLINVGQLIAALQGVPTPFSRTDLEALLPQLCQRAEAVGQAQRSRTRYWKFEYLRQQAKNRHLPAILVDAGSPLATVALPEPSLFLKVPRKILGEKLRLGQRFHLRLGRVDPLGGDVKILDAFEV